MSKIPEPNHAAPLEELVRRHSPQILARCQAGPEEFANLQDKTFCLATRFDRTGAGRSSPSLATMVISRSSTKPKAKPAPRAERSASPADAGRTAAGWCSRLPPGPPFSLEAPSRVSVQPGAGPGSGPAALSKPTTAHDRPRWR